MNRRALIVSAGAMALAGRARADGGAFKFAADLDATIARIMTLNLTPGLGVAVYSRAGAYARAFGVTDMNTGEPATTDTAFYVASSTKSLTSLALASLHQKGKLNLDSTLAAYAPDAPFPADVKPDQVRLRDLLSHTGGIENNAIGYRVAFTGEHDPQMLWRLLASSRPNAKAPLGRFEYTNIGYNIATILTDRKLGVRWQDLLQREIFSPAGMAHSTAVMSQAKAQGWSIAEPHALNATGHVQRAYLEKTDQTMQSAGGVVMSANDAVKWLEFMIEEGKVGGRQVIPAQAVRSVCAPAAKVGNRFLEYQQDQYGLGWYIGPYREERMLHDFGGFAGFRTHVSFLPERGIGVAVFANDSTIAFTLVDAIADYIYDLTAGRADASSRLESGLAGVKARRDLALKQMAERAARPWMLTRPRSAYAGVYQNDQWGRIEVTVEGDAINARFGLMHAVAEPFTTKDSVRLEFRPGSGDVLVFLGEGPQPDALGFLASRFARVTT